LTPPRAHTGPRESLQIFSPFILKNEKGEFSVKNSDKIKDISKDVLENKSKTKKRIQKRTEIIHIRVTKRERTFLEKESSVAGLSPSELIRRRFLGKKVTSYSDYQLINKLCRLGGLFKYTFKESDGSYSEITWEILEMIRLIVKRIADDSKKNI
jgi:hypothetical protein